MKRWFADDIGEIRAYMRGVVDDKSIREPLNAYALALDAYREFALEPEHWNELLSLANAVIQACRGDASRAPESEW